MNITFRYLLFKIIICSPNFHFLLQFFFLISLISKIFSVVVVVVGVVVGVVELVSC